MAVTYEPDLALQVKEACGENANLCFQCRKCTAGCPLAEHFDIEPHRLLRQVQLGQKEAVLRSRTIWLCAACETCTTRCPQGVDLPRIMDALKIMAAREGITPPIRSVPAFYSAALRGIRLFGRMYEAGTMGELYLRQALAGELDRQQFLRQDIPLALHLLRTGKFKLLPPLSHAAKHEKKSVGPERRQSAAYYPGCSLHGTAVEYDLSTRAVAPRIGLELIEPPGWTCCGTTPAHSTDHLLATVMPLRNLALMEAMGQQLVTVPCPSCFTRFRTAMRDVTADPGLREQVAGRIKSMPSPTLTVEHLLTTIIERVGLEAVSAAVTRPLAGLRLACYYGCVITRPPELTGATDAEYPMSMDLVLRALGAETLDWQGKTDCCGASLSFSQLPIALEMSRKVLDAASEAGAEAIAVACPLCQANLDMRQRQIRERYGRTYELPILYFTQVMGLAFGLDPEALGMGKHLVSAAALLQEKGI